MGGHRQLSHLHIQGADGLATPQGAGGHRHGTEAFDAQGQQGPPPFLGAIEYPHRVGDVAGTGAVERGRQQGRRGRRDRYRYGCRRPYHGDAYLVAVTGDGSAGGGDEFVRRHLPDGPAYRAGTGDVQASHGHLAQGLAYRARVDGAGREIG